MINFNLGGVSAALVLIRQNIDVAISAAMRGNGRQPLHHVHKDVAKNNLKYIHDQCARYLLTSAEDRVVIIWKLFSRDACTYNDFAIELKPLLEAFEADLKRLYFYHYPHHKALTLIMIPGEWAKALAPAAFPSIKREVEAGVDCYAFEHNEACIFHMMRIAELGLRALGRERQVTFSKRPLEWAEWENIIDGIESKAKAGMVAMSRGPGKDAAGAFYTAAVAQLRAFKETRNRIMHMRGVFDELDALRAINQVRDFMNGLSAKVGEKTRTPIRRWP